MKQVTILVIGAVIIMALIIGGFFVVKRWISSVAVHTTVTQPAPHIECVTATSVDGIAIDCNWSPKQPKELTK